jgi:4-hydroxy-tetrahydrodipicolinate reductase
MEYQMKIAVIGTGKTGGHLIDLIPSEQLVGPFNSKNPATVEKLQEADVVICFVTGEVFLELCPLLIESKKPVLTGATGFEWPSDVVEQLHSHDLRWLHATNFSMGVQLMKPLIQSLSQWAPELLDQGKITMTEWHHTKKVDAPSGTALTLKEWLDQDVPIESVREGDIVGIHTVCIETPYEKIDLTHTAKDRKLFASGAINLARKFFQADIKPGLYTVDSFFDQVRTS